MKLIRNVEYPLKSEGLLVAQFSSTDSWDSIAFYINGIVVGGFVTSAVQNGLTAAADGGSQSFHVSKGDKFKYTGSLNVSFMFYPVN